MKLALSRTVISPEGMFTPLNESTTCEKVFVVGVYDQYRFTVNSERFLSPASR